jgi:SAM-dependent methyltransferase
MEKLSANYWNSRYESNETAWDLGTVSPPIKIYIDQLKNKDLKILIPGAGNAYEALYLLENGFTNITIIDFAELPLKNLKSKLKVINESNYQLINEDFFKHRGEYDLILEQTFFCAINPNLRTEYVNHCHQLLSKNGKIVGVLFNKEFPFEGPPFGGNENDYRELFMQRFIVKTMEVAYNSVAPRQGSELFVVLERID